jgi:hypothetical protein
VCFEIFIPPLPEGGGGYTVLPLFVCLSFVRPRYFKKTDYITSICNLSYAKLIVFCDKLFKQAYPIEIYAITYVFKQEISFFRMLKVYNLSA